jgi:hypothetical protein
MAKKSTSTSPEEKALQELLKKAYKQVEASQKKEASKKALQAGKELAMLLRWLQELYGTSILTEEMAEINLAQMLKDYPTELKKVLAYYRTLMELTTRKNFAGFQVRPSSLEDGRLWISCNWLQMELPKDAGEVEVQK